MDSIPDCSYRTAAMLIVLCSAACSKPDPAASVATPADTAAAAPIASGDNGAPIEQMATPAPITSSALHPHIGKCVLVEGRAFGGGKTDPHIHWPNQRLWVAPKGGREAWMALDGGALVRVRGEVRKASGRLEISEANVEVVRSREEVLKALDAGVGGSVELQGTLISRNGHWWLNAGGVDVHLDHLDALREHKQHFALLTIKGKLTRDKRPRIDQIIVKKDRDLAETFVLSVQSSELLKAPQIQPCP